MSYYRDRVIRGPGAFVEVANDFNDYREAMKRKLLREIGTANFADIRMERRTSQTSERFVSTVQ